MLRATLNHEEVGGSPLSLNVVPGAPCLSASVMEESALMSAVAGQTCTACLRACNAFGTPLSSGGAPLIAAVGLDGASIAASSLDISWIVHAAMHGDPWQY